MIALAMFFVIVPKSSAADDITGHWAEANMRKLIEYGVMNGDGKGSYRPNDSVTRAEFAKLVIESLNLVPAYEDEVSAANVVMLTDLEEDKWYYPYVISAVEQEIIKGFEDGTFRPNEKITREQMATMIMRAINLKEIPSEPIPLTFKDKDQINADYALEHVQRIVSLEIMNGLDGNLFAPGKSSTRAEVATVLIRMINLFTKEPVYSYTNYPLTLNQMIDLQMKAAPKTDKYRYDKAYVNSKYLTEPVLENGKKVAFIKDVTSLNVYAGTSESDWIFGKIASKVESPTKLEIKNEITNSLNEKWYEIVWNEAWRNAKSADVAANVDPSKFQKGTKEYFQFLDLSRRAGVSSTELNNKIFINQGVLTGMGDTFIKASIDNSVNEVYLVAHAILETGNGKSSLASGVLVDTLHYDEKGKLLVGQDGKPSPVKVEPKKVYNIFGIGAFDSCDQQCGAERAYREGWTSVKAAIEGGARYISKDYIHNDTYKQDTLYEMRWNPAKPATHQYATDVEWAKKQVTRMYDMYQMLDFYMLYFDVPVYKK